MCLGGVGACFLMFFCSGLFGVWLVRVLLVWGMFWEGYKSYKVTFMEFCCVRGCFVFGACVYSCPWVPPKH